MTPVRPGPLVDPRGLHDAIAREEARLLHLQTELGHAQARLAELKTTLAAHEGPVEISPVAPSTALEKVALFRSRFRGRDDIYPRFWSNARTGRKGYAPTCGNEWIRGVCEKPRVKCGECPNQAFLPVEDKVILDHLQGRHVVGVYPLLTDDTCWLLAADFDKASWTDDVAAFAETCRAHGLPAAVERSRFGNGAHVWFFSSAPVAASAARQLGCYLITETMSRRHQLSMGSYDRLFPNQDILPRGGFGNLIALPLQHGPRQMGNTVFIDNQFVPHPDQWQFLSTHPRIEPATVESLSREATRRGLVVGVRLSDTSDSEGSEPWLRRPSGEPPIRFGAPLPSEVRAVLAQRLFVAKGGLAPTHLNQIRRLAAFQNPEFYKKESLRLSTALTPRVIACAEDLLEYVAVPRGCQTELEQVLREYGSALLVEDQRCEGQPLNVRFHGQLPGARSTMRSKPATLPRPQMGTSRRRRPNRPRKTRLDRLIEEAIVDAYGESEQAVGLYTMIEDHLALPFETMVLGVPVTVVRVDLTQRDEIVAVCRRAGVRQAVPILDLPLPSRRPAGAEWIDAYRGWARGRLVRVPLRPRHGTAAAGSATRSRCLTQIKNSVVRDPAVRCRATDLWVRNPQGLRRAP